MFPYHPPAGMPAVVYRDADLLVVDKPAGLLSVPGRGEERHDSAWTRVCERYPDALVVHRLDMATSGLLVFALNRRMQAEMGRLFAERRVSKTYEAMVTGHPRSSQGVLELPLITDWPNRPRQKVDWKRGKPAVTHWKVIDRDGPGGMTRMRLVPVTGRSHQLRVHMMALGHPIVGDELYGGGTTRERVSRLLLHARRLAFPHPRDRRPLRLESEVPF